ncbi:MAG TPA: hypothetical protein VHE30_01925 [Polyangiaceae bacterium]|nr:hypothetical protein [Polyangiaceae bacterium]
MLFVIAFLLVVATIGGLLYVFVVARAVPGVFEQRVGALEALPPDVGQWKVDVETEEGRAAARSGQSREVRLFYDMQRARLLRQVRYRNPATRAIMRVEPDVVVPRRRVRT